VTCLLIACLASGGRSAAIYGQPRDMPPFSQDTEKPRIWKKNAQAADIFIASQLLGQGRLRPDHRLWISASKVISVICMLRGSDASYQATEIKGKLVHPQGSCDSGTTKKRLRTREDATPDPRKRWREMLERGRGSS
jgi:hypothetical protein